jgi:hypothetical protein
MPANTGKFLPVLVFGVPNTGIPVSEYTGLETLMLSKLRTAPHRGLANVDKNVSGAGIFCCLALAVEIPWQTFIYVHKHAHIVKL